MKEGGIFRVQHRVCGELGKLFRGLRPEPTARNYKETDSG